METDLIISYTLLFVLVGRVSNHTEIPSNFFGSSEVFSGYSSEQQQYIDAFSLHPDYVLISGTIQEVEHELETTRQTGKATFKSSLYVISCELLEYIYMYTYVHVYT